MYISELSRFWFDCWHTLIIWVYEMLNFKYVWYTYIDIEIKLILKVCIILTSDLIEMTSLSANKAAWETEAYDIMRWVTLYT